jgi:two-component system, cell cycle response regulator
MLEKSQLALNSELKVRDESSCMNLAVKSERSLAPPHDSLLLEANQELASLLQEYRDLPPPTSDSSPRSQYVLELLSRAMQCAVKQQVLQGQLSAQSFTDELTGLYNRRGFLSLAEQQLKLASRAQRECTLFFIDVDGLKQINDTLGHSAGDSALICTAEALVTTFRDSDILGRLGGDEFIALAIDSSGDHESSIVARLGERLKCVNSNEHRYLLSLSVGAVRYDPNRVSSIEKLIRLADQAMYRAKRSCRSRQPGVIMFPGVNGKILQWNRESSSRRFQIQQEQRPVV